MISAKLPPLDQFYKAIIYIHDVTKKMLSRDSNEILDAVMWPKFGNPGISVREVIITSIW